MTTFNTIADVKRANRKMGHHWFSRDTMAWFKCRIESDLIDGRMFVTSEKHMDEPRLFTVREAYPSGDIGTVGEFQQHATRDDAMRALYSALGAQ